MAKDKTPSFILEFGLEANAHEETELNKRFEVARQLYNACLSEAKRRLLLLRQSKEYQHARSMPKTVTPLENNTLFSSEDIQGRFSNGVNGKPNKERTLKFKALNAQFGFREYDLHIYVTTLQNLSYLTTEVNKVLFCNVVTKIRNSWIGNHINAVVQPLSPIDSTTAQKIATRAFSAVQRVAFGKAFRIRFKGKNQFKSVEGKTKYCHKCPELAKDQYTKKPLSQRVHTCCNLNIQRDLYSAFLAGSVVENNNPLTPFGKGELDTADVNERWRSMETILQRAVSNLSQAANVPLLRNSFGLSTRDRAARLRSSDVLKRGIPDAKAQDVVA